MYIYIYTFFFVKVSLRSYRLSLDHQWKNLFYVCELEKDSVEHREYLSNFAEISRGSKISARTNLLRTLTFWLTTRFFDKQNTVLPREVPKSVLCMGS